MKLANAKCQKCGRKNQPGVIIAMISGRFICGECIHEVHEKQKKQQEEMYFEENG